MPLSIEQNKTACPWADRFVPISSRGQLEMLRRRLLLHNAGELRIHDQRPVLPLFIADHQAAGGGEIKPAGAAISQVRLHLYHRLCIPLGLLADKIVSAASSSTIS